MILNLVKKVTTKHQRKAIPQRIFTSQSTEPLAPWFTKRVNPRVSKKQAEEKPPPKPVVQKPKTLDLKDLARKINDYPFSPEAHEFFKLLRPEIVGSYAPNIGRINFEKKYGVDTSVSDKKIATSEISKKIEISSADDPLRDAGIGGVAPLKESGFSGKTTVNVKSFADAAKELEDEIKPQPDPQIKIVPKEIAEQQKEKNIQIQIPPVKVVANEKVEIVETKEEEVIIIAPTSNQLKIEALRASIPFIGFGCVQNLVLIYGGDVIETAFGNHFGITLMTAALCGNAVANASGAFTGKFIASNVNLLPQSKLNAGQKTRFSTKFAKSFGATIGVIIGCLLGMIPLLFTDEKLEGLKRMFNRADKNKDGKISRVEIDYFFSAIGMQVSLEEIDEFVWKNDNDYDGQLNFEYLWWF